jgi:hypothetical protein
MDDAFTKHALEQYIKRKELMKQNYAKHAEERKAYRRNRYAEQKKLAAAIHDGGCVKV